MASEPKLLLHEFLKWVAAMPRSYAEARGAWGSTCPLTCVWEDAISDNLVAGTTRGQLVLTADGEARLRAAAAASPALILGGGGVS